eukprot:15471664-Alexandrium_andersonii.AAC.1
MVRRPPFRIASVLGGHDLHSLMSSLPVFPPALPLPTDAAAAAPNPPDPAAALGMGRGMGANPEDWHAALT